MVDRFADALRALLPAGVAAAAADPSVPRPPFPGEIVAGVAKRQAEFAAGRFAARLAMRELAMPPAAIPARADRAPDWPPGLIGSITHTTGVALAAVARRGQLTALGIDIEAQAAVLPELWPVICRDDELSVLNGLAPPQATMTATAIFCAKEAAYKAQYPLTGLLFDFHRLAVSLEGSAFVARFTAPTGRFAAGDVLQGRLGWTSGMVLAAVAVHSQNSP